MILVCEYGLFRQYALREITWAYPTAHDQIHYLSQAYETVERILGDGLAAGLRYGVDLLPPQGLLLHLQAAVLFLLIGTSRLSALTLNFVYFAVLQCALAGTLRWVTRGWAVPFIGLGLLLTTGTPFFWAGGLMDFRPDFIAFCLMGVVICVVMRSGVFASTRWSLAVGAVAAYCVVYRFITLVYLLVILGLTLAFLALRLRVRARARTETAPDLRQVRGLITGGVLLVILATPAIWISRHSLRHYYAVAQVGEGGIRAQEQKISTRWDALRFYPRMIVRDHAGPAFLMLSGVVLGGTLLLRLGRGQPRAEGAALGPPFDFTAAYAFVLAGFFGPLMVLIPNPAKSPVVGGITVPALVWLVVLPAAALSKRLKGSVQGAGALAAIAGVALGYGVYHQFHALGRRDALSRNRADVVQVLRLYDEIARYCSQMGWTSPVISVDVVSEYLNAAIPEPLVYERQGWLLQPKMALGGSFDAVKERHAVSVLGRSDFAIITLWSAEVPTIFPFDRAMQELRPRLLEVCQRSFVPLGDFRFSDRQVRLYVRPSVALDGEPDGWISSRGLTISGAARVFRARPRIELQGNTQFEWLGGRVPVARAELVRTDGDFRTVPVKLVAAGPSYRMIVSLDAKELEREGPVQIRVLFDTYFVPRDLGINGDTRQLVIRMPRQVELLPQGGQDDVVSVPERDRPRLQRGS